MNKQTDHLESPAGTKTNPYLEEVDGWLPGKYQHRVNDSVPLWHLYDDKLPGQEG